MIFLKSRHGFTVLEMMVVLIIIGIIFGAMNYLSPGPKISRTKSDRIATALQDSIKSAQRDILTGRAPSANTPIVKKLSQSVSDRHRESQQIILRQILKQELSLHWLTRFMMVIKNFNFEIFLFLQPVHLLVYSNLVGLLFHLPDWQIYL